MQFSGRYPKSPIDTRKIVQLLKFCTIGVDKFFILINNVNVKIKCKKYTKQKTGNKKC